jgi:glycopeptide antibiotics resistance protein
MSLTLNTRRLALIVLPLVLIALFPIGWLGELYRPLGALLDGVFNTVAIHAVAHAAIFFALGLALLAAAPELRRRPLLYFGILLLLALGQEGFQLMYKQRPLAFDDFRDIVTDVLGMAAAYLLGTRK